MLLDSEESRIWETESSALKKGFVRKVVFCLPAVFRKTEASKYFKEGTYYRESEAYKNGEAALFIQEVTTEKKLEETTANNDSCPPTGSGRLRGGSTNSAGYVSDAQSAECQPASALPLASKSYTNDSC